MTAVTNTVASSGKSPTGFDHELGMYVLDGDTPNPGYVLFAVRTVRGVEGSVIVPDVSGLSVQTIQFAREEVRVLAELFQMILDPDKQVDTEGAHHTLNPGSVPTPSVNTTSTRLPHLAGHVIRLGGTDEVITVTKYGEPDPEAARRIVTSLGLSRIFPASEMTYPSKAPEPDVE